MSERTTSHASCVLCEANCGIDVEHDGERLYAVRGDDRDPISRGHVCPKAVALIDVHHDPDRVRGPLARKADGTFRPIRWADALELAADRLDAIRRAHGKDAIAIYVGNPTAHSHGASLYLLPLLAALGTKHRFSSNSVDALPRLLVSHLMYGSQALIPVPDLDRTDYFLILGANPVVSNGSIMGAPDVKRRLRAIRERGGRLVVIDPRRTETADIADEHHFIQPSTDAHFLAAILRTILEEGLVRPSALFSGSRAAELAELVAPFTPERVAGPTGIDAASIRRIARELAAAKSAVCYGRMGTSTQDFGALATWLIELVNLVSGNLDRAGGSMFTTPAVDLPSIAARLGQGGSYGTWKSRVRGLPEVNGELPAACLAEEIEREGGVRALIVHAGNPVLSNPGGARLDRAIAKLDFVLAIDLYVNETTRHADLILPPTFALERDHYALLSHAIAARNSAKYSRSVIAPPPGVREDWWILHELAARLFARRGVLGGAAALLSRALMRRGPRPILALLLRMGPHALTLRALEQEPHGVDLGPLVPRLASFLAQSKRSIELVPAPIAADLDRAARSLERARPAGLRLVSRRLLTSNNSWMHNAPRLARGRDRCTLEVHPDDARARGIRDGARVEVRSASGCIVVPVVLSDRVMPGVVCLPHGYGHDRPGAQLRVAGAKPGASVNDITDSARIDPVSGASSFVVDVEIALLDEPPRASTRS